MTAPVSILTRERKKKVREEAKEKRQTKPMEARDALACLDVARGALQRRSGVIDARLPRRLGSHSWTHLLEKRLERRQLRQNVGAKVSSQIVRPALLISAEALPACDSVPPAQSNRLTLNFTNNDIYTVDVFDGQYL